MVGSKGKGMASVSKSNSKNLALLCAESESMKCGSEESAADPLDGKAENSQILDGANTTGEEKRHGVICGLGVGNRCKEEQLANLENDEGKEAANENNIDKAKDVPSCGRTEELVEEVNIGVGAASNADVGDNEERMNEMAPEEEKERIQDGIGNNNLEDRKENKSSEAAVLGNMNTDEGLCASEHGMMEESLKDNIHDEEANQVNAEEPVGTPTNIGKIECTNQGAGIGNDIKSSPGKVNKPKKRLLKKKVVKKKIAVWDEAMSQSSIENEASGQADKADTIEGVKIDEKAVPEYPNEAGKDMRGSEVDVEGTVNIGQGTLASDHGVMKEKLLDNLQDEASGELDKQDTKEDAKNEEKAVSADHENIAITGGDASSTGNVKVKPEKANAPKRKFLKKKVVQKVVLGDAVTPALGEANEEHTNKDVKNGETVEKAEMKPAVRAKRKRVRKKVRKGQTNAATAGDKQNPEVANDDAGNKKDEETVGQDLKTGEAAASGLRGSRLKKRKRKMVKEGTKKVVADGNNNPVPSEKSKNLGRTDNLGMIFMCNSETKKDCYRYKVFGLPAGKKNTVLKIYKGMRLFLFDVDQRMMYGIYEAAGPGGYNIEPRAFKALFPSQVRFTVLRDCVPLAEEKFRKAISDNYYAKNKFSPRLTNDQVNNLCKLFTETSQNAEPKPADRKPRNPISAVPSSSSHPSRKRKRGGDTRKSGRNDRQKSGRTGSFISSAELEKNRRRRTHEEVSRAHEDIRQAAPIVIHDDRYQQHRRPVVYDHEIYERQSYLPPAHLPPRSYSYDYEGASSRAEGIYRNGNSSALEHRRVDIPRSSQEWLRPVSNVESPYVPYIETRAYRDRAYEPTQLRRDAEYASTGVSVRPAEYYRVSDTYLAPLPPYRRY